MKLEDRERLWLIWQSVTWKEVAAEDERGICRGIIYMPLAIYRTRFPSHSIPRNEGQVHPARYRWRGNKIFARSISEISNCKHDKQRAVGGAQPSNRKQTIGVVVLRHPRVAWTL